MLLSKSFSSKLEVVVSVVQTIPLIGHYIASIGSTYATKYLQLDGTELTLSRPSTLPAGKIVKLCVRVTANTMDIDSSVRFQVLKNGIGTTSDITIGEGDLGLIADTSEVAFADNDTFEIQVTEAIVTGAMSCVVTVWWQ